MESKAEFEGSQFGKGTDSDEKSNGFKRPQDGSGSDQQTGHEDVDTDQMPNQTADESQMKPIYEKEQPANGKKKGEEDSGGDEAPEDDYELIK